MRPDPARRPARRPANRPALWGLVAALALAGPPLPAQDALERLAHDRLMARIAEAPAPLAPFTTDGCSGGMSEVWAFVSDALPAFAAAHGAEPPWQKCCVTHDRAYHGIAGARDADDSLAARRAADEALRLCVRDTARGREATLATLYGLEPAAVETAYALISAAMYRAVRAGGLPCSGLPWRWGYGLPAC